jgi:hypothetical protein
MNLLTPVGMQSMVPTEIRNHYWMKHEVFLTQKCPKQKYQVKKERIINNQVRKQFYDIPCVGNMIAAQILSLIGKAVRILTHFDLQN